MGNAKTRFTKVSHIGDTLFTTEVESSLKMYLDWGFLNIGGFSNIESPNVMSTLRPVHDPSYTDGQVWESPRKDWVWETGIDYSYKGTGYDPIQISGVYINGSLYNTGSSGKEHHYNYPLGRVVFDEAISTSSNVTMNYSPRDVQTYISKDAPWFDEIQYNSYTLDSTFDQIGSGNWSSLSNSRVQLPAVVIEFAPRRSFQPLEMGSTTQVVSQDINFHILAEDKWWRNQILDIISNQKDISIFSLDMDEMLKSGVYPLDHRGSPVDAQYNYENLVNAESYKSHLCRLNNMSLSELPTHSPRLHEITIRGTFEITKI